MEDNNNQSIVYKIDKSDTVVTALTKIEIGISHVHGETDEKEIQALEEVDMGHKLATRDIQKGENIIKYGIVIGESTGFILKGAWVHLHNCKSRFDERSSTLDLKTGVSTDIIYESGSKT